MTEQNKDVLADFHAGKIPMFERAIPAMLTYVNALIGCDEMALAQDLLVNGMPGYFRDNPPKEVLEMKKKLMKFLMNSEDYANNSIETDIMNLESSNQTINGLLRGQLVLKEVKELNDKGKTPHVIEMGPGEYWLAIGLKAQGCKFTYKGIGVNPAAAEKASLILGEHLKQPDLDAPVIYVACEIIEHLWNPQEIAQTVAKLGVTPDYIHMSTPLYTFGVGHETWFEEPHIGKGGHLRTYTPSEFMLIAQRLFPNYNWVYYHNQVMSLRGSKNGS